MACKSDKAMAQHGAKEDCFIEADTPEAFAQVMRDRRGGTTFEWRREVNLAINSGVLIATKRGGKDGYRTRTRAEHERARAAQPKLEDSNNLVGANA